LYYVSLTIISLNIYKIRHRKTGKMLSPGLHHTISLKQTKNKSSEYGLLTLYS
jgi:hypothetical protein